jgi:hypothetical protein
VFNDLSFIEPAEASSLDCRDVDKHILAAALRLNIKAAGGVYVAGGFNNSQVRQ